MHSVSDLWRTLLASPGHRKEVNLVIAGVTYGEDKIVDGSLRIDGGLYSTFGIGNCCARQIEFEIYPQGTIPRQAKIEVYMRLRLGEQVSGKEYYEGQKLKVYLVEVRRGTRGPQMLISRTHPGLVKRLFELEVPEIYDGTVEVRSIAREAGNRTKIAVWSEDPNVDAIGACVGPRGQRVNAIVDELRGEKIDIVKYSEDPAEFIAAALAPADVVSVQLADEGKACRVTVPADQLSLAIGKEGQNARLAARLTGYKIDIKAANAE